MAMAMFAWWTLAATSAIADAVCAWRRRVVSAAVMTPTAMTVTATVMTVAAAVVVMRALLTTR